MALTLPRNGRSFAGMDSYVFRPMIMALTACGVRAGGGRVVTRAKNDMSVLMRGQGRVAFLPIPSRGGDVAGEGEGAGTGVVATMRVRGAGGGVGGGILGFSMGGFCVLGVVFWSGLVDLAG